MEPVLLARAEEKDATAILKLQRQAYQLEAELYNDWSIPPLIQTLSQLQEEFTDCVMFKATSGGSLLGSVRARAVEGVVHVGRLIVAPSAQRRGIGSALLLEVENSFATAERFELFTGSLSVGNIRLYRKHGYVITHQNVLSPAVTLVFMCKRRETAA